MMLLTRAERERFAQWLENEAATSAGLVEQMLKIRVPTMVVEHERRHAAAALLIAKKLRATEDAEVSR